jgi:hypothetical protein
MAKKMPRHEKPDWAAVIACIASQEGSKETAAEDVAEGSGVLLSAQSHAYVRVQRFLRKICPGWALEERTQLRDGTLAIAQEFNLSQRAAARLTIALANLAFVHATEKLREAQSSLPTVGKALERIEKSVGRIADFSRDSGRGNAQAIQFLIRSAARWASSRDDTELARFGFNREIFRIEASRVEGVDHAESAVVHGWFELAPLMMTFIKQAQQDIEVRSRNAGVVPFDDEVAPAQQSLIGYQLPRLYERIMGRRFGLAKSKEGDRILDATGVKFVRMAIRAIGVRELSPETVASHWKAQNRFRRSG